MKCEICKCEVDPKPWKPRFCSRSCSAVWRMRDPDIRKKVHNPGVRSKIAEANKGRSRPDAKDRMLKTNPMFNKSTRIKVSNTLKKMKHKPKIQGGNGRGMTTPQLKLLRRLKGMCGSWEGEKIQLLTPFGFTRRNGYPSHYKIDIASEKHKIAIEVDGGSHSLLSRKAQDKKKTKCLEKLGWVVLRFKNSEVMHNLDRCVSSVEKQI